MISITYKEACQKLKPYMDYVRVNVDKGIADLDKIIQEFIKDPNKHRYRGGIFVFQPRLGEMILDIELDRIFKERKVESTESYQAALEVYLKHLKSLGYDFELKYSRFDKLINEIKIKFVA